jgi:hypothetical protein
MRHVLFAAVLLAAAPAAAEPPALADRLREELERAAEALRRGMDRLLIDLEEAARALPRYEMPQMLDNGDIVIRRKPPEPAERPRRERTI